MRRLLLGQLERQGASSERVFLTSVLLLQTVCKTLSAMQRPQVRSPREIQALREELGWSRSDLAAALNVTRQTISNWERGVSQPSEAVAETMAAIRAKAKRQQASGGDVLSAILTGGLVGFLIGKAFSSNDESE